MNKNRHCDYCFKLMNQEAEDDRYIYTCIDDNCIFWDNGRNENIDRTAESLRELLQDDIFNNIKHTEIMQALLIVAKNYEDRIKPYNESTYVGNPYTINRRGLRY